MDKNKHNISEEDEYKSPSAITKDFIVVFIWVAIVTLFLCSLVLLGYAYKYDFNYNAISDLIFYYSGIRI